MLQANNLSCGYSSKKVLDQINLKVCEGEIFSLVGLNGAGKTTLLKTFLGLLHPLGGELHVLGSTAMLEADPSSPFSMSLTDLMKMRRDSADKAYVSKCLNAFEATDFFSKNILELSAGQAKRAWLAHLFSLQTKIIIIDEPFSHLDWNQQRKLCKTILAWRKEFNTTFVIAAHELELVTQISDRIGLVGKSTLLACDTPDKVLTSPIISELFAFKAFIDENPIDGSKRITLGKIK